MFFFSEFAFVLIVAGAIREVSTDQYLDNLYSFLVKISAKGKALDCAGSILSSTVVLTSAHCVDGVLPEDVTVSHVAGTVVNSYETKSIITHPKYNNISLWNDIALLHTKESFKRPWRSVALKRVSKEELPQKCKYFEIVGWSGHIVKEPPGGDNNSVLNSTFDWEKPMQAPVKLISLEECSNLMENFGGSFQGDEKLCGVTTEEAKEDDESGCFTGPGGPLLCSNVPRPFKLKTAPSNELKDQKFKPKEDLAEPIDLLASLNQTEKVIVKREVGTGQKNWQVGVVSWGESCSKVPSVYVRTDGYYDWISDTIDALPTTDESNTGDYRHLTPLEGGSPKSATRNGFFSVAIAWIFLLLVHL